MGTITRHYPYYDTSLYYLSGSRPTVITNWTAVAMGEVAQDIRTVSPPITAQNQSDSEGSNSSLELDSGVANIELSATPGISGGITCRWQNCGLWFNHLDMLASHVTRVHAAAGLGGLFYCGWEGCTRGNKGFNARYKMLVHVRTHTNEKPHRCCKCDKSFSRAENLKIHARSHTGERPYVCPVPGCGKAYSNSSDRFKHTRTHSVDKPYCCKVPGCPKRYTDPSSLRKHVKTYRHYPEVKENESATDISKCTNTEIPVLEFKKEKMEVTEDVKPTMPEDNKNSLTCCRNPISNVTHENGNHSCNVENSIFSGGKCVNCTNPCIHLKDRIPDCHFSCCPLLPRNPNVSLYTHDIHYNLYQSWFHQAEIMAFPKWGLPMCASSFLSPSANKSEEYNIRNMYQTQTVKRPQVERYSFSSQGSSDDGMEDQDSPLDLTVHMTS